MIDFAPDKKGRQALMRGRRLPMARAIMNFTAKSRHDRRGALCRARLLVAPGQSRVGSRDGTGNAVMR